jgi:hypothetical protein
MVASLSPAQLVVGTVEGGPKARLMDSRKVLSLALDLEGELEDLCRTTAYWHGVGRY